ncbi:Hypothetical protein HDN1F_32190 [gamma proteobacterium HdN1]|nr:Hypothetical protein HDN1F_32190 [gamma proteobacterium HdN1]
MKAMLRPMCYSAMAIAVAASMLSGCNNDSKKKVGLDLAINSFDISSPTGTNPESRAVQINSGIEDGAFRIHWEIKATDILYRADVYLSEDGDWNDRDNKLLLSRNCGGAGMDCRGERMNIPCRFTNDNRIVCDTGDAKDTTHIGGFLKTIPQTGYIVLRACNAMLTACDDAAVKVEFQ